MACKTLATILKEAGGVSHVDFLSLDVEMSELEVLEGFDFDAVSVDVIQSEGNFYDVTKAIMPPAAAKEEEQAPVGTAPSFPEKLSKRKRAERENTEMYATLLASVGFRPIGDVGWHGRKKVNTKGKAVPAPGIDMLWIGGASPWMGACTWAEGTTDKGHVKATRVLPTCRRLPEPGPAAAAAAAVSTAAMRKAMLTMPQQPPPPAAIADSTPTTKSVPALRVAFAVLVVALRGDAFAEQLAVLAHSIRLAGRRSAHRAAAVALVSAAHVGPRARARLAAMGYAVRPVAMPLALADVRDPGTRRELERARYHFAQNGTEGGASMPLRLELIKYHAFAMTDFDHVFLLDGDTLVLDPMDELVAAGQGGVLLAATLDYYSTCCGQRWPPVNGGFLSVAPDRAVYDDLVRLTKETPFVGGSGWMKSNIGYYYGGIGPQGLLAFYFFHVLIEPGRRGAPHNASNTDIVSDPAALWPKGRVFLELDQCAYNVIPQRNCWWGERDPLPSAQAAHRCSHNRKGACKLAKTRTDMKGAFKVAHFTGSCSQQRPWNSCQVPSEGGKSNWICPFFHDRWWETRGDLQRMRNVQLKERVRC